MAEFAVKFNMPKVVYITADDETEARRIFDDPQTDDEQEMLEKFEDDEDGQAVLYVITEIEEV